MDTIPNLGMLTALTVLSWLAVYGACSLLVDLVRAL